MRETSAKTVTQARYFSRYSEITVGADGQIADTTQLLLAWAAGDAAALDALAPRIYQELHRLAVDFMKREREEPILQATALVHEVYLKLIDVQNVALEGKAHFYAICAQMMRRILVDAARKRAASRHGGGLGRIHLDDVAHLKLSQDNDRQLIALNDALDELAQRRSAKGESCGTAILRRVERARYSRRAQGIGRDRYARLASGAGLVATANQGRAPAGSARGSNG